MAEKSNADQIEYWNGAGGDAWLKFHEALDVMLEPVAERLLGAAALKSGERVLDIGCGCGETTLLAAKAVGPGGKAVGVDVSAPLLKIARERAAKRGSSATFIEADAAAHAFAEKFDHIISRFGVMFFADPVAAFTRLKLLLAPHGQITFICWRTMAENGWVADLMREAAKLVPLPPRPDGYAPGPFAFGDRGFLDGMLKESGLGRRSIEKLDLTLPLPGKTAADVASFYKRVGPLAALMRESDAALRPKLEAIATNWVDARFAAGMPTQHSAVWLARASV